jgi:hypothetical protein
VTDDPLAWLVSLEGVASAYAAARDGIDVMLRDRGLRRTSPEITAESLLRGAHASAVLEGSTSTLEEIRSSGGDEVAQDAVRLSVELLSLVPVIRRTPLQAFARMHVLAGGSGHPRGSEQAGRLRSLSQMLLAPTRVPALVVAALVHADLATVAPFDSRNGLVARAAERLVLVARGVDEKSLVVPEAGHLALRQAYESNLRGYASGTRPGLHSWLLYGAEAFSAGAEASPLRDPK